MTASGVVYPLVGLLVLVVPGLALQLAAGVRDKLWLAALTVPASIGVYVVAGVVSGIPGIAFTVVEVLIVTAVLVAIVFGAAVLVRRRTGPVGATAAAEPPSWLPVLPGRLVLAAQVVGALLCLLAVALAFQPWRSGLGGWDTFPQEHDTIIHTVLVGYISHTGNGAPWELLPLDMLTGQPVSFYPSGLPLTAALSGELAGGPVVGFNVINALCAGPAFVLGSAALVAAVLRRLNAGRDWTALAGGVAAIVAAGLYRPGVNLLHDGGIAPNAVAMSLTPGLIAAVITIGRGQWLRAVLLGLGVAGVFAVHPSMVASVGGSLVVFWIVEAFTRSGRAAWKGQLPMLAVGAVIAAVAAAGQLIGSVGQATRTGSWQPDIGPAPFGDAVGTNLVLSYGGYFDPKQGYAQLAAGLLALLGVAAVLMTRRAWGALAMWLFWLFVSVDFKVSPTSGVGSLIGSAFYKSYVRIQAHVSLFVPLLAALGVVFLAIGAAKLAAKWERLPAFASALRKPAMPAAVLAGLILVGYLLGASRQYEHMNAKIVAQRYAAPEFVRVNDDDRKAADWLKAHVKPGERVMNSANDGSTYSYVADDVPVVNVVTLGAIQAPYTYELLKSFRDYPSDPKIRQILLSLNVAYVYTDSEAPTMGAGPGAPNNWLGKPTFTLAPGLQHLDGLPGLSEVFTAGTVKIYRLDRTALESTTP
ncbi:DUF6541 family protein [Amycolatopsis minnesotensis]|uniref:4-amino-4-deoxy-L-arabinose transferase-like glycosyltransferase n=1 Tax=Amycolatopsis minnesotensis TaxID=337894 RepID=A0ABP5BYJ9_9PSEU